MPSRPSDEFAADSGDCPHTIAEGVKPDAVEELFASDPSLGGYQYRGTLGKGGMGTVVEAFESATGRKVALKVVPRVATRVDLLADGKESKQRFETEVKATARLQHSSIVPIYAVGHGDGFSFYTMRLVNGVSMTRLLIELAHQFSHESSSPLSLDQVKRTIESICRPPVLADPRRDIAESTVNDFIAAELESTGRVAVNEDEVPTRLDRQSDTPESIGSNRLRAILGAERTAQHPLEASVYRSFAGKIADIADALQYASDEGVVHRDVKPGNILVDGNGKLFLADFGLAKIHDPDADQSTACVGTPGYIAPERLRGQTTVDPRSDVFALGLVLEQLVTLSTTSPLREPLCDDSQRSMALSSTPRPLRRIIYAATADNLADRYESAGEFAKDLRRFVRGEPVLAGAKNRQSAWISYVHQPLFQRIVASAIFAMVVGTLAYVVFDRIQIRDDLQQIQISNERTVSLYLDMVDDLYLKLSKDSVQSSMDRRRPSKAAGSPSISATKRDQLLKGIDHLDELATTQSNHRSTICRIAQSMSRVGFILQSGGYRGDAARLYNEAETMLIELSDDGPRVALERAWIAYHRATWQHRQFGFVRAADDYRQVIGLATPFLDDESIDSGLAMRLHEILGMTHLAQENFQDAVEHLEVATDGDLPGESRRLALATAYRMVGRYRDALPIAEACAIDHPDSAFSYRNLAAIQMHLGDVERAVENFEMCVSLDPNNELALQGLAWAKHRQGDTASAIDLVNQAIEISSANEVILTARAVFCAAEGRFDESVDDLLRAYDFRPGSGYVADKLFPALLFFPNADVDLADQLLTEHQRKLPPVSYQFARALVDYARGRYGLAAAGFRELPPYADGLPPDSRPITLTLLCEARSEETPQTQRADALLGLEKQRQNGWPHFGLSPFDQAMVRHIESFLDQSTDR